MAEIRLPDLETIKRFSIAVRSEHADADEVIEALRMDLQSLLQATGRLKPKEEALRATSKPTSRPPAREPLARPVAKKAAPRPAAKKPTPKKPTPKKPAARRAPSKTTRRTR